MDKKEVLSKLSDAITNFDVDQAVEMCKISVNIGIPAYEVVLEGMNKGMDVISQKYDRGDFFLSELIMAGETMKEALKIIEPYLRKEDTRSSGTVVLGTVQGDLHDIGKNIFANLLRGSGFRVIDLGFDVSPKSFVDEVERTRPNILGMSALVTTTMVYMGETVSELMRRGLRDKVKVIIGGAPVDFTYALKIGADAACRDAVEGVAVCKRWVE